ncbi:hypothetical protein [Chitiniphilus eburneus]|uniref:Uncharacterized protein n=1 Tax=Chitiniphilus eburneus TaxID=2571148 RepID=A0A4U0PX99_9NEIS|nr:hypothetical protein [Chitiniphilus eburneus]TJZ73191.1 hypothetical protein FAZ21_11275 [Chitiniphilus eburneus]
MGSTPNSYGGVAWMVRYGKSDTSGYTVNDPAQTAAVSGVRYRTQASQAQAGPNKSLDSSFGTLHAKVSKVANARIAGGSLRAKLAAVPLIDRLGRVLRDVSPATGSGIDSGPIDYQAGHLALTDWPAGNPTLQIEGGLQQFGDQLVGAVSFRTPVSPLRPSSLTLAATSQAGTTLTASANADGVINSAQVVGRVDYQSGVARVYFRRSDAPEADQVLDVSHLGIAGVTTIAPQNVYAETVRYSAVGYTYLPLDAAVLGLDPVRLPSDGRVPIYRKGGFVVVGNEQTFGPNHVSNGQTLNLGRTRLSRIKVLGADGSVIATGYSTDLDAGTVTFTDVTGYAQPVTVIHRIEDMAMVSDVQISGRLSFTRPLTHAYPAGSSVSSALVLGDQRARVSVLFDQQTWNNTWADAPTGAVAPATYDDARAPLGVTNAGALTERWALEFTAPTQYRVTGEHVGQIATGNTGEDCSPVNPATGAPYFTIKATGWGSGWAAGNVLRFNTVGALGPVWLVRTVQQGPETVTDDRFELIARGDVDRP